MIRPEEIEELGNGPLTLEIVCTECDAIFELSKESVAMALLTRATFIEYLKHVQSSDCPKCKKKSNDKTRTN